MARDTNDSRRADEGSKRGKHDPEPGFGDEQGTRVGRPDAGGPSAAPSTGTGVPVGEEGSILEGETSRRGTTASDSTSTGAGAEAAEGLHSAKGRSPHEKSGVESAHGEPGRGEGAGLSGSEPLRHRETEHKSGYGGEKAEPKTSSEDR